MSARALAAVLLAALVVAGCATPGDAGKPTLQEVRDTACPVALGLVIGLQVEPAMAPETRAGLAKAQPLIETACAATATAHDLLAMSEAVFPVIMNLILESNLGPSQKQEAVVAITAARLVILNLPSPHKADPAP